jgi:predicted phosphodiesterase
VDGLSEGTRYAYRPLAGDVPLDEESVFRTDDATRPYTFLVYGDHGDHNSSTQIPVRDLMLQAGADFVVSVGDMVYPDGAAQYYDSKFFVPYAALLRSMMIWPCLGNHDDQADEGASWRDAFITPANNPTRDEDYYSFDAGNAHFVVLESNDPVAPGGPQARFLERELTASHALWKFVVFHHTIYSSGNHHGSALTLRANIVPILDRHHVDLVLMGHEHNYERTPSMRGDQVVADGQGTMYVTTGGGGADLYDVASSLFTAYSESAFHFVRIAVDGATLHGEMIREDGVVRDTFMLTKTQPTTTTTTTPTTVTTTTSTTLRAVCAGCDDGNRCTTDGCDQGNACVHDLIPGCCRADAECADDDLCTTDECQGAVCQHAAVGFASLRRSIEQGMRVQACAGETLPHAVTRLVSQASTQVLRAATARRTRQTKRLLHGAAAKLARGAHATERAARQGHVSQACAAEVAVAFEAVPFACLPAEQASR